MRIKLILVTKVAIFLQSTIISIKKLPDDV